MPRFFNYDNIVKLSLRNNYEQRDYWYKWESSGLYSRKCLRFFNTYK